MARNLSKDLKRLVAGLCAVLVVGGTVPLQPLVNFNFTIKAAAINSEATYTKNSPELIDGVTLKKGESIDLTDTRGRCNFSTNTKVDFYSDGSSISHTTGWGGITRIYVDDQGNVKAYVPDDDEPYTSTFIPENGYTFKFTYNAQKNWIDVEQVELNFVRITSANDLANMTECSYEDAKAWINNNSDIASTFAVVYGNNGGSSDIYMVAYKDAGNIEMRVYVASTLEVWNGTGTPVYYLASEPETVKTAALSFDGFTAGEDYAVENDVTEVEPGDTVTIYTNKKFNTNKDYATAEFETAESAYTYNQKDYKYKCTVEIRNDAYFANDETISFTEQAKVYMTFKDLEEAGYFVDYNSEGVYVTDYVDVYTNKRMYLDESIFNDGSTSAPPIRFVEYMKETTDGGFDVNNSKYLYRYHITFPQYPYISNSSITFIAEKNVDLVFENMAENKKFAVKGDLPYAYVADGSVIYSDQTIAADISQVQLKESTTSGGYEYNGETYKYKYDVTYSEELRTGDTVTFSHVHEYGNPHVDIEEKPDIIIADCTGENGEEVGTVEIAQLKPDEVYYYGDLPTVEEIVVKPEQMPKGITSIKPVSLAIKKKGKTTTQDYFTDFGTYELSAIVNVVCGGKTYPISITKEVEYAPRAVEDCEFFLQVPDDEVMVASEAQPESEQQESYEQQSEPKQQESDEQQGNYKYIPLVVEDGIITLPENSFVYNKEEQKPVIVVKNTINGKPTELTEEEISSTVEGKTGANKDNEFYEFKISAVQPEGEEAPPANYVDEVTVKWRIEKAPNNVTFVPKTDTVYDAEALDDTDFTFTDPDETLKDSNIKVEVQGKAAGIEGGTVTATEEQPYTLSSADNMKKLDPVEEAKYYLPDDYTYAYYSVSPKGSSYESQKLQDFREVNYLTYEDEANTRIWRAYDENNEQIMGVVASENYYDQIAVLFNEDIKKAIIIQCNEACYQYLLDEMGGGNYDITSAGVQKGTITITSDNYQDKVMDFETEIAKKEVTVAPNGIKDNDTNTITWGELIDESDILYSQDGVVDKDKRENGEYDFGLIFTAENYNFEDASKNNVGEYKLVPSQIFAEYNEADNNYYLVLPKEESEEQIAQPAYLLSTEQEEPGESEEATEEKTEDVKLDTLTIVPYELTKDNVSIVSTEYKFDTYTKTPNVTVTVPYSVKDSEEPKTYELTLGTIGNHAGKDAFIKGVRYDDIVGEKNLAVLTDGTTSKNFTAGDKGLEFKWYIQNGSMTIKVGEMISKIYDGVAVPEPSATVTNQVKEPVANVDIKKQYQKKDEKTGEFGEAFDEAPKDAGTYRAVVTAKADSYNEAVEYSNEFTISKREVTVNLFGLPEVNGYNDTAVDYTISEADPDNPDDNTGIINNEVNPGGTVTIKAGKKDGDHITNADLSDIAEALGDNYTFTCDIPLTLRDAKLDRLVVYKAYMDNGETIDPNDYFTAYDENGKDITDQCRVINIDNIDQLGDYTIEVNDGSLAYPLTGVLYVKPKSDEIAERIADLPDPENVTVEDERPITDAREAYDALSDEQKENVSEEEVKKLEDAEKALEAAKKAAADQAAAKAAADAIDELPEADKVTVEDADDIEAAREAYDALTDDQKALVDEDTVQKLEEAEEALEAAEKLAADQAAADPVKQAINALPAAEDVKVENADAIAAARQAYDALTDDQKALVDEDTVQKLEDAEEALEAAKKVAADEAAADVVKQAINALPAAKDVTVEDADAIAAVREAFDALTDDQRGMVEGDTRQKLDDAEEALEAAKKTAEDQATANAAAEAINALPAADKITKNDAEAVANARKLFDSLTDEQKAMIDADTLKKLTDDEAAVTAKTRKKGDVNGDGKINTTDLMKAAAHAKGKKVLSKEEFERADINGDGKVNNTDVTLIAAHVKGKKLIK
ncbi:dockerin type I domain-containing protein [Ruminococcus sp.]|uniref:dockerin type I domain-containing protein n=1 Tax=Ruminococcus sp. TaxID=41978 RepID=UPI0025E3E5C8|nr:dockerin type I domain-containing protein [Ruminococcus sp.]